jgi:ppGpp synthetase/RelA/SpoT-type nucleotidyltranferase
MMTTESNEFDDVIDYYKSEEVQSLLDQFLNQVEHFFKTNHLLKQQKLLHSIKSRPKDPEHLRDKLKRKQLNGLIITKETLFKEITDLNGVRLLHLYQQQFPIIHNEIMKKISELEDWTLIKAPKAYTWEPESEEFFTALGIGTEVKETYYTSVHYVIKPNNDKSSVSCEIQVRTLFEEIWGEIDHTINYPHQTDSVACKEQIRVLAKLVSTGTRLADSIFRTYDDHLKR